MCIRDSVLDTVDELGYDASSIARKAAAISQADNKLYRVELLLCPLAEQKNMLMLDYFDEMLRGIQSYFSRHGNMTVSYTHLVGDESAVGGDPGLPAIRGG